MLGIILVFRDITERRQTEQTLQDSRDQLAVILQGIADGVTVQTPTGELLHANEAAVRLRLLIGASTVANPSGGSHATVRGLG